jgi:glycerophosphoryl diester phosphodiesterase
LVIAEELGAASIHVQQEIATRPFLDKAWEAGLDIHIWTVNEVRDMETFASLGVQGIASDFPERFGKLKIRD